MTKKLVFMILMVALVGLGLANGKTIVWVSDAHDTDTTVAGPDDQGWVDFLTSLGFTVEYPKGATAGTGYFQTLDAAKLAQLAAADLIIMSRDVSSGNYANDDTERAQWGGITTPLILMSQYLARSGNGRWFNTTAITARAAYFQLRAVNPADPLFDDVLLDANKDTVWHDVNVWPGHSSFINTTDAGNGRVLAVRPDNGNILIAEWDAGKPFYNATPNVMVGGPRMLFSGGTQEVDATQGRWGAYNLTAAGEQIFVNALKRYLGDFMYNSAPQVNAGPDQSVNLQGGVATAQLAATVQDDGDPYGVILYDWRLISGPAPVVYTNGIADPTVQFSARGAYEFRVTVYDYDPNNPAHDPGKSASDTVRVRVKDAAIDDVLLGHWTFDEGQGKTANDSAGINDAGTLTSTTTFADPNWVDGWVGDHALAFYGISYVQIADATPVDANLPPFQWEITTAAWIKVNAFNNPWETIMGRGVETWRFGRENLTNRVTIHLEGVQESLAGSANVNDGYWHHVAATYDGKRVVTYVDGRVDATMDVSGPITVDMSLPITIGNRIDNLGGRGWNGLIDDVRLYTYAISAEDVIDLAKMGKNVIPSINAGPDITLSLTYEDSIVLDAVGMDLNDDTLAYEWTVVGPAAVEFIPSAYVEKPTVRFSQQGVYTFHVTVNDGIAGLDGGIFDEVVVTTTRPSCADIIAQGMSLATDLNKDCYVDLQDLAILAANWARCYDPQQSGCENPFKWE
ncbi:MAG: LamG domain-containing protein [Phycisphaerae bacterium]|nr:LamG domain-containing protein [Phycisphaerae bacterium]